MATHLNPVVKFLNGKLIGSHLNKTIYIRSITISYAFPYEAMQYIRAEQV